MEYMEQGGRQRATGRKAGSRPERTERIIAAAALALVLLFALLINSFFYGFETPQRAVAEIEDLSVIRAAASGGRSLQIEEKAGAVLEELPEEWNLVLVDSLHPVAEGAALPQMTVLRRGEQVDSRIYPSLQQMFDDMRAQGLQPLVTDGYHSAQEHEKLLDALAGNFEKAGESTQQAKELAEYTLGAVGANEHELGICADITSEKGDAASEQAVHAWLQEHAWEYGFILRYPADAVRITGVSGNPRHYRYVGMKAAREMHERELTLEEYLLFIQGK